jgi:hypothetical protein
MALDKTGLKNAILAIFENMATREDHPETAREDFATQLSDAIDMYVRTGTVTTTGTASAQTGTIS